MEPEKNFLQTLSSWIVSLAISVTCCAVLFLVFANFLTEIKKSILIENERLEVISAQQERLLHDIEALHRALPVAAPAVAAPADAAAPAAAPTPMPPVTATPDSGSVMSGTSLPVGQPMIAPASSAAPQPVGSAAMPPVSVPVLPAKP